MDGDPYEELCRRFIAAKEHLPLAAVEFGHLTSPKRRGVPRYRHQLDLYWKTETEVATYLNIANAKWRGTRVVQLNEVLLLQQVRLKMAAHKAFMITNTGFTRGAIAAAMDEGIGLHIVQPSFDWSGLPKGKRDVIQTWLDTIEAGTTGPMWTHDIVHKGLEFDGDATEAEVVVGPSPAPRPVACGTRLAPTPIQKPAAPPSSRTAGGGEGRGGPGWGTGGDGAGGVGKK
jgi:hypothetical protein